MSSIVSLDSVGVRRRHKVILDSVTLSCEEGTLTSIRGSNGSGKSTLLGIATGLMEPSSGKVLNLSKTVSYLPERFTPPSGMDTSAYLRWIASTRGIPRRARADALSASLNSLGFTGPVGPMRLLSKGNLQRVGIAGALIGQPELIVLDEPFTGMDRAGTELVAQAIERVRAAGSTLLLVHHGAAPFSASQSFGLENGTLRQTTLDATPRVVYLIRASAEGGALPILPDPTVMTRESPGRFVITSDANAVDCTMAAILDAGWTVNGVERQ